MSAAVPARTDGAMSAPYQLYCPVRSGTLTEIQQGLTTNLGATTTYTRLLTAPAAPPLLRRIAGGITGGPQIRNQGTIGGSACHANPASDIPAGLVALDATMVVDRQEGQRRVPARDFFAEPFRTDLQAGELLTAIEIPTPPPTTRWGHTKLKHGESSWPIAVAAARIDRRPDGSIASASVTLGAAVPTPLTIALDLPENLTELDQAHRRMIGAAVDRAAEQWWSDDLADDVHRRRVGPVIAARAVAAALPNGHRT
jgi:aerobic carbon-monoxide dehydrogenase medium subunit